MFFWQELTQIWQELTQIWHRPNAKTQYCVICEVVLQSYLEVK